MKQAPSDHRRGLFSECHIIVTYDSLPSRSGAAVDCKTDSEIVALLHGPQRVMKNLITFLPSQVAKLASLIAALVFLAGCSESQQNTEVQIASETRPSQVEWLSYRVRSDFGAALNADTGWAAPENTSADIQYDQPFRLRVQVRANMAPPEGHLINLQYRQSGASWLPVGFAEFPYPSFATPVVSVISTEAYQHGAETERLLGQPDINWDDGAGLNAMASTPVWRTTHDALEWEWPLVIRRFSDGPTFAEDGATFQFRLVDGFGQPLDGISATELNMSAAPRHLGGTFIETPSRIGPYQSETGHLYFFMEPSETDNRFMAVKSTDFGNTWQEVDGENRPSIGDLEGVATARTGSTVHMIHQISEEVFYHQFEMDGAESETGVWRVNSESIATLQEPPTQFADLVARSDGSLVALYAGPQKLFLQIRSAQGVWGDVREIDTDITPDLSGPALVAGPDDTITMAYTGRDGSGFIRHLLADGNLSQRQLFSTNTGISDSENGAIVPMVVLPETGTTVLIYREQDGLLYERRFTLDEQLSEAVLVSQLPVVTNAVDSEQAGADLILHDSTLHLLFIEAQSRTIYYSNSSQPGIWSEPQAIIENVDAAWVRGSVHLDASGTPVYGFVYDAGSTGGSGFNRYYSLAL